MRKWIKTHVLFKIIDCVKFCGAFELALRGHDETESLENPGIFRGLVDFVVSLVKVPEEHLKTATVFKGTSKTKRSRTSCWTACCPWSRVLSRKR